MITTALCPNCSCYFRLEALEPADLKGRVCDHCADMIAANACEECERGCDYPLLEDLDGYMLCEECYEDSMLAARKKKAAQRVAESTMKGAA